MIRKMKNAFSLAEILIALAIISVIATMGFTITKKNIESAYDMYFYTGYTGLYNAIADANDKGKDYTSFNSKTSEFTKHINDLFRGELTGTTSNAIITAPNHIKYSITKTGSSPNAFKIVMTVPSVKSNDSSSQDVTMYYVPEKYNFLILTGVYATKRIDLFPFYIDDGIAGKSIQHCKDRDSGKCELIDTPEYTKRKYYTFKDAYCKAYKLESLEFNSTYPIGYCTDIVAGDKRGAIKLANPKKVF